MPYGLRRPASLFHFSMLTLESNWKLLLQFLPQFHSSWKCVSNMTNWGKFTLHLSEIHLSWLIRLLFYYFLTPNFECKQTANDDFSFQKWQKHSTKLEQIFLLKLFWKIQLFLLLVLIVGATRVPIIEAWKFGIREVFVEKKPWEEISFLLSCFFFLTFGTFWSLYSPLSLHVS